MKDDRSTDDDDDVQEEGERCDGERCPVALQGSDCGREHVKHHGEREQRQTFENAFDAQYLGIHTVRGLVALKGCAEIRDRAVNRWRIAKAPRDRQTIEKRSQRRLPRFIDGQPVLSRFARHGTQYLARKDDERKSGFEQGEVAGLVSIGISARKPGSKLLKGLPSQTRHRSPRRCDGAPLHRAFGVENAFQQHDDRIHLAAVGRNHRRPPVHIGDECVGERTQRDRSSALLGTDPIER
ncbi:MAG: hypothetical protein ACFHWZ_13890 [Phycisphaerales bacterium]